MALTELKLKGHILRIKGPLPLFKGGDRPYWYVDIHDWLISIGGKKGDTPVRKMRKDEIRRVQDDYLPRVRQ